jgi:hypothetical protein
MNKECLDRKEAEIEAKIMSQQNEIIQKIHQCVALNETQKNALTERVRQYEKNIYDTTNTLWLLLFSLIGDDADPDWIDQFINELNIDKYIMDIRMRGWHRCQCLDSDPIEFDGDIIITDPCYIIKQQDRSTSPKWEDYMKLSDYSGMTKAELVASDYFENYKKMQDAMAKWEDENPDDWDICECGHNMGALGLKHYMTRSTISGDWSCTTFNSDTQEPIGKFCADAGQVAVFLLKEVLEYNHSYTDYIEKPWCVTTIKDFHGTVQFVVEADHTAYGEYYHVRVIGKGINKTTGKPLNFITSQTGL